MFAYCGNAPIIRYDSYGNRWDEPGKEFSGLYNRNSLKDDSTVNCDVIPALDSLLVPAFALSTSKKIGNAEYYIHNANTSTKTQKHIHIIENGKKYSQNIDGTSHHGDNGKPTKTTIKKLKESGVWDWEGNAKKQSDKNNYLLPENNTLDSPLLLELPSYNQSLYLIPVDLYLPSISLNYSIGYNIVLYPSLAYAFVL
jgi:hypothetical protein